MARIDPKFMLRLPANLKDRVQAAAANNSRSMNAEIVAALEDAYPEPSDLDLGEFITRWSERLNKNEDAAEAERLVATANQELEEAQSKWRLEASQGEKGLVVRLVGHVDDWRRV